MKNKLLLSSILCIVFAFSIFSQNQSNATTQTTSTTNISISHDVPVHIIPTPNLDQIQLEDQENDSKGLLYRIGVSSFTNLTSSNSGVWTTLTNGDKKWQLVIKNSGAEALSFIFDNFKLSQGSTFYVQNMDGQMVSKIVTKADQLEDFQQHIALCFGDNLALTLIDKANATPSEFTLNRVIYNYRSTGNPGPNKINESGSCEVNVNCPEGANYQDEKRGVARIYVVGSSGAGWCSGTLVNNTAQNCKPLFLTALHCGPSASTSVANMNLWKFYFRYEATACVNPTSVGTLANNFITGCVRLADSNDNSNGNILKSDFLLVQLGTLANEATTITTLKSAAFNAYWNGWDANNTAAASGVGIHHPAGDIKKISTFSSTVTSTTYSGSTANTHWKAQWVTTATNWGVTEGGSSGSALFVGNGGNSRIIGTLSGGASYCGAATSSANDLYGKMSYHWVGNGTTAALSLKYHLDPTNTGLLILDGSNDPCAVTTLAASVVISSNDSDNTICAGTSVTFTAFPTNGGTTPTYQWKLNGTNIAGETNVTYTTTSLTTGQSITCQMTSNLSGVTASPATSNAIITTVNSIPATPVVTTNSPVCLGSAINLTTPSVSTATYAWTGANSYSSTVQNPTISVSTAPMSGAYNLIITVNGCSSVAGTSSVVVSPTVTPSVVIAITSGSNPTCATQSVTFTATPTNEGTTPIYQWQINGMGTGTNSATFTPTSIANNAIVTCVMTTNVTCPTTTTATSNSITMTVTGSIVPAVSISTSETSICTGTSTTFTAIPTNGGATPSYQWKVNNNDIGTNSVTFTSSTLANNDIITCVMTSSSACASPTTGTSNAITMTVSSSFVPSVSISLTAGTNPTCTGSSVTFTAVPTNGGTTPSYQWKVNNNDIGTNSVTFTSSTLANNDIITCIMNSSSSCASPLTGTSNPITINLSATVTPTISVALTSGTNPACQGTNLSFTANSVNGGTSPSYTWKVNGVVISGANSSIFSTSTLLNNDVVTCVLTSNAPCASSTTVSSTGTSITINSVPATPTITNVGTVLTSSSPTGNQWYLNGVIITGAVNQSYTSTVNGSYSVLVNNNGCTSALSENYTESSVSLNENEKNDSHFMIYPNPNKGVFTVVFSSTENLQYKVELMNELGQTIYSEELIEFNGSYTKDFDVSLKGKGVYFLKFTDATKNQIEKVIVY